MPPFITDNMQTWLRAEGVPSTSIVSEADLNTIITASLARYSHINPLVAGATLTLVSGTQDYALDDTWIRVAQVLYHPWGDPPVTSWEGMRIWWMQSLADDYIFDNPSLAMIWFDKFSQITNMHGGVWETYTDATTRKLMLRLMPPPPRDGTLPILGHKMRSVTQIEEVDRDLFGWIVKAKVCMRLAMKPGVAHSFSDSGMSADIGGGVASYREMAEYCEQQIANWAGPVGQILLTSN